MTNSIVENFVISIIDRVRFLYKDKAYEHENEKRIIVFASEEEISTTGVSEGFCVPRLFIDLKKELKYKEIVLGPKVSNPSDIAPYLINSKMVGKVKRSAIKYR